MPSYGNGGIRGQEGYDQVNGESSNLNGMPRRPESPLPAPQPQRHLPRQSLEGETIFAVGDDDRDRSDSESDDDTKEDKRLRGKKD